MGSPSGGISKVFQNSQTLLINSPVSFSHLYRLEQSKPGSVFLNRFNAAAEALNQA